MTDRKTMSEAELSQLEADGATVKRTRLTRKKRNLPRTTVDMDHDHGVLETGRTTRDKGHDHELLPNGRTSVDNDHDHKWAPKRVQTSPKEVEPPTNQVDNTAAELAAASTQALIVHNREVLEEFSNSLQAALQDREKKPLDLTFEVNRDDSVQGDYKPVTSIRVRETG